MLFHCGTAFFLVIYFCGCIMLWLYIVGMPDLGKLTNTQKNPTTHCSSHIFHYLNLT